MSESFSVWRNGIHVGDFDELAPVMRSGGVVGSFGVLRSPEIPADIADGVFQMHADLFPGSPVFEWQNQVITLPGTRSGSPAPGRAVAAAPVMEEGRNQPSGISGERIFSVRTPDGSEPSLRTFSIDVYEWSISDPPPPWFAACGDSAARRIWTITFARADAPA